ncbi:MAG TPA: hypothetical protein VHC73_16755 [Vitreimonas sp.]|nr:hypothetical protein [Vitreimonas sp.]
MRDNADRAGHYCFRTGGRSGLALSAWTICAVADDEIAPPAKPTIEAVLGAAPVFALYGAEPPTQYTRPGRHGIYLRDWEETLDFLDAHLRRWRTAAFQAASLAPRTLRQAQHDATFKVMMILMASA